MEGEILSMYFLKHEQDNPKYLNNFLKYARYILRNSENSVNAMYSDIKTFLRYINLRNSKCKDITKERLREAEIINIEIYDLQFL